MRILVTGAGGLLGSDLVRLAGERGHAVAGFGRTDLDVTDAAAVRAAIRVQAPEVVVNCAAFTDVDAAEDRPEAAERVNRDGAGHVARAAAATGARLVHIGTDYVFRGDDFRPRREEDPVDPLSVYGRTKAAGEAAVAAAGGDWLIVRTAWLYGRHGRCFVETIRRKIEDGATSLRVVSDRFGSPTWSVSLAEGVLDLVETPHQGIVHFVNRGTASWHELAVAVVHELGREVPVIPITSTELGRRAPRPLHSALDTSRFEKWVGREPAEWRVALASYLAGGARDAAPRPAARPNPAQR